MHCYKKSVVQSSWHYMGIYSCSSSSSYFYAVFGVLQEMALRLTCRCVIQYDRTLCCLSSRSCYFVPCFIVINSVQFICDKVYSCDFCLVAIFVRPGKSPMRLTAVCFFFFYVSILTPCFL